MLQALTRFFETMFVEFVTLTLDVVSPPAAKKPDEPALPDSQALIAHFRGLRASGETAPLERRAEVVAPPPAASTAQSPGVPLPAYEAPAHDVAPPPTPSGSVSAPSVTAPAQPAPPTAALPPERGAATAPSPGGAGTVDHDRFAALGLTTPAPATPASIENLPAAPVRAGAIDPALAHEFGLAHARDELPPTQTSATAALPLSPARSGRLDAQEAAALRLPRERAPDSLTAAWARLPQSPVGAPSAAAPSPSVPPATPTHPPHPEAVTPRGAHEPPPAAEAPPSWPDVPEWPLDWNDPPPAAQTRPIERPSTAWYV